MSAQATHTHHEPCVRCGGEGKIVQFSHVDNGVCYRCNGTGNDPAPAWAARKNREFAEQLAYQRRLEAQEKAREGMRLTDPKPAVQGRIGYRREKPVLSWLAAQWNRHEAETSNRKGEPA